MGGTMTPQEILGMIDAIGLVVCALVVYLAVIYHAFLEEW